MLRSYFLTAWRNILRNRIFSIINIAGLAIGMTVVFHIYRFVSAEQSYDTFYADAKNIFRVPLAYMDNAMVVRSSAANHPAVGPMLKQDFPEIEQFTRLAKTEVGSPSLAMSYTSSKGDITVFNETNVFYADEAFFSVFTFSFSEGNPKTSLERPQSIVLSRPMARKYFGAEPGMGKSIRLNKMDYIVTGVLNDMPENTHLKFDAIASMSSVE